MQAPQWVQKFFLYMSCLAVLSPSGLWHHLHLRGQPFKNTVILGPGPS